MLLTSCSDKSEFSLKLIPVKSGDKWGYIDKEGKYAINPQFDEAHMFIQGMALVKGTDGKYGFIDEEGKYKINPLYKSAQNTFSEGGLVGVAQENGKIQFVDKEGKIKATLENADRCYQLNEGMAAIMVGDKWGFADASGSIKINPTYDNVTRFGEGLAAVAQKDEETEELKWGFIDKEGKLVINYQFSLKSGEDVLPEFSGVSGVVFRDGLAPVSTDGEKWGYINKEGNYEINPQFDKAFSFFNEMALVRNGETYGYIDKTGKYVINPQFMNAYSFRGDLAPVQNTDGKWGFVNKEGKYEINPQFDNVLGQFIDGIAVVKSSDVYGLINEKGAYVVNPQFEDIYLEDIYLHKSVASDYVNAEKIADDVIGKAGKVTFHGMTAGTTLKEVLEMHPDVTEDDLEKNLLTVNYPKDLDIDNTVFMTSIGYYFYDETYTNKAIYKTVQKYNYWSGGYTNVKELDHYEKLYNDTAKILALVYNMTLLKTGDGKSKMVADELKEQIIEKGKVELRENPEIECTDEKGMYIFAGDGMFLEITYSSYASETEIVYPTVSLITIFNNYGKTIEDYEDSWVETWIENAKEKEES